MSRPSLRLAAPAVLALTSVLGLAACTDKADSSASPTAAGAGGPIVVNATDTACERRRRPPRPAPSRSRSRNTGSKVNEFYVYAEGDRIISEVENITPGLKRQLKVEITEPGTFTTACKPGMVGDGIRARLHRHGHRGRRQRRREGRRRRSPTTRRSSPPSPTSCSRGTEEFVAAVKAGDVDQGQGALPDRPPPVGDASSPSPRASATSTHASTAARTSSRRA